MSLAPFCSISPSISHSQSPSPSASRRGLCLLCYAIPHSKFQHLRINNKPKQPPLSTTNLPGDTNFDDIAANIPRKRPQQQKQYKESLNHYHSLLAFHNPATSTHPFNALLAALVRNSDPAVFSFFNCITRTDGIKPDNYTYGLMIKYCAQTNRLDLAFCFLGMLLKEDCTAEAAIFSPIMSHALLKDRLLGLVYGLMGPNFFLYINDYLYQASHHACYMNFIQVSS